MARCLIAVLVCVGIFLLGVEPTLAQAPSANPELTQLELVIKIVGGIITGVIALIGLPVVLLTYKKTSAEIRKLELEARKLETPNAQSTTPAVKSDGVNIQVRDSPGVNVQVFADPRLLAPLLLLVDFVLAWIVLTLTSYVFSIFVSGTIRTVALGALAATLLLPMVKQVLQVRAVLQPPSSVEQVRRSISKVRIAIYAVCILPTAALMTLGAYLFLIEKPNAGGDDYYFAWIFLVVGGGLGVLFAVLRHRIDRYLASLVETPKLS